MPLFNWPYTNLHSLNLDWIIKKIKNVETAETNTAASEEAAAGSAASAAASQEAAALSEANAAASEDAAGNYYNNIRENVSTLVTGWLDEHVTPTSPVVDSSLSISGAAADAKVTGDGLNDLKNALKNALFNGFIANAEVWQRGGVDSDGNITTQAYRVTTTNPYTVTEDTIITLNNPLYRYTVNIIGTTYSSGWRTAGNLFKLVSGNQYRLQVAKVTENYTRLTDSEVEEMSKSLQIGSGVYGKIDNSISMGEYGTALFSATDFIIGVHYNNGSYYAGDRGRVTTEKPISFPYETRITADIGYRFAMIELDSQSAVVSYTNWLNEYLVKPNTNYYINVDNGDTSATADVNVYVSKIHYRSEVGYRLDKLSGIGTYTYYGVDLAPQRHGFNSSQLPWSYSAPTTSGSFSPQAMSYYGGVVFKCWKDNLLQLYDFATGNKIAEYAATIGHGDAMDFSNEFYASGDEFPLAYFAPDNETPTIYVNRLTRSGATLLKTLTFNVEEVGYYAASAVDAPNNRLIMLGYAINSTTVAESNHMICTVWNLNNIINEGGTLTPELMKSFTLPFMNTTQDQCYYNNKLFVISSQATSVADTVIYVVDIGNESIITEVSDLPYKNYEHEGIFWVDRDMYLNGNAITKITFTN